MRHRNAGFKLGRNTSHRRALLRNLVTSVIVEDRVETTVAKAKAVRPHIEKMITLGKKADLHARRQALSFLQTDTAVKRLFDVVAPRYGDRNGGYLRIVRTGFQQGDGADKAFIELLFGAQQFDEGLLGPVALLETGAHDAQVAARAVAVARSHGVKETLDGLVGHEKAESQAARSQIALLAEGNHLFHVGTDSLGLGHGGLHAVFHEDGRNQIAQERAAMAGVASELESCIAMAHGKTLFSLGTEGPGTRD